MPPTLAPERDTSRYAFDDFEIDVPAFELRKAGRAISMEPQVFEVLRLLVRNHDRCLSKDEILDTVWPERYVTEAALNSRVMSARKALGDDGRQQRYIKTIHGRGYRFIATVAEVQDSSASSPPSERSETQPSPAPGPLHERAAPPTSATTFVGRERELARLRDLISQPHARLISIVGPGGIGKTRLLLEALPETGLSEQVVYVPLQTAIDDRSAAFAVAAALGISLVDVDHCQQLVAALANRRLLLALDNFEQLAESTASQLSQLLQAAPGVRVVVTSRAVLGLAEEWIFRITGLPYQGDDSPAARLFRDRVTQGSAHLSNVELDADGIAQLCAAVDGMPLAIELAASLARYTPASELAERVRQDPASLASGLRNLPERHRSLGALFDEAFARLSASERESMEALAIFSGSFSADAAAAVAGATAEVLHSLADQSLLHAAEGRFHLHPLVRQYVLERGQGRAAALHQAHAEYFARFLHSRGEALKGAGQVEATLEIEAELPNVGRAWRWACDHARSDLLDAGLPLLTALTLRGRFLEADDLATLATPVLESAPPGRRRTLGEVLVSHAWLRMLTGRPAEAMEAATRAGAIADEEDIAYQGAGRDPAMVLAVMEYGAGDYARSLQTSLDSRERAIQRNDPGGQAFAAWFASASRLRQATLEWRPRSDGRHAYSPATGDTAVAQAAALVNEAGTILEGLGETWLLGFVEIERGMSSLARGDVHGAISHFERARSLGSAFADPQVVGTALIFLADQYVDLEDWERAAACEAEARRLGSDAGDAACIAEAERLRSRILLGLGRLDEARGAIVGTVRRSQAIDFANNAVAAIKYFGDYARATGVPHLAAEALAFVAAHPAATPFTRAKAVADLAAIETELGAAALGCIRRHSRSAQMSGVADRVVALLGDPGPLPAGASLFA